jgi:succinate dehydrogenase / fumarate reductase cytochrome b subunit
LLSGLIYHLIAGVKHLLMDIGIGEEEGTAKVGAVITIALSTVLIALTGVWLW